MSPVLHSLLIPRLFASVICVAAFGCLSAYAQGDEVNSAAISGKVRFQRNCGICHGIDGKGAGAFSEILKVEPPDLTVLTKNNDGSFPFTNVYNAIDGRNTPLSHGREGMPIWGDRYKQAVEDGSETLIRGRILELIVYLDSIQSN